MISYLYTIDQCIKEKMYFLSIKYDKPLNNLIESYNRRKDIITKCYPEYHNRQSHILFYAYKGVERDLLSGLEKKVE